jgi:REase_DpnII-MboI
MKEKINKLIKESEQYHFQNNCYQEDYGVYSRPSIEMQAWIANVEDLILTDFGEESAPWRVFGRFSRESLDCNTENEFEKQKAIILSALHACLRIAPKTNAPGIDKAEALRNTFDRFHLIARQLRNRYNGRATLDIEDEYDVQDLLSALLRLHFDDIRKEEWTPSYAGGSARMDFLLKQERIVIEVKKTRKTLGDKDLGNQLIEDKARYQVHPDCRKLICFVYDPDGRITNPRGISNDLNSKDEHFEVQVIIKPDA